MRKKLYHPFYEVTILCEIIVRVRVTLRVRVSMLSVSVLSVQPDSQGLHLRYPRYGEDPDTGWSRGTQILGA